MTGGSIWSVLGIPQTKDVAAIRKAYARRLRETNPEDDQEGFKRLRQAYETALRIAQGRVVFIGETPFTIADEEPEPDELAIDPAELEPEAPQPLGGPAAAPPPSMDQPDEAAHAELCNALARLLADPAASPDTRLEALERVLRSPAMDFVTLHQRTEAWLARLLAGAPGPGDVLLDRSIGYFGWALAPNAQRQSLGFAALRRREDIGYRQAIANLDHGDHPAYSALTRAPRGRQALNNHLTLRLPAKVAQVLQTIEFRHQSLLPDLNPEALAYWRRRLANPQLGPGALWAALAVPVLPAFVIAGNGSIAGLPVALGFLAGYALSAACILAIELAWLYGFARPRARWRADHRYEEPAWRLFGWAPAALALVFAAALLPPSAAVTGALIMACLPVLSWVHAVGRPDDSFKAGWTVTLPRGLPAIASLAVIAVLFAFPGARLPWRTRAVVSFIYLAIFWFVAAGALAPELRIQMTAPLIAAGTAFVLGAQSLIEGWRSLAAQVRRTALAAGAVAAAATPLLLWKSVADARWAPLAMAVTATLVLLHKAPAAGLGRRVALGRDIVMRYGWLLWLTIYDHNALNVRGPLYYGGLWLLSGVAIAVVGALALESRSLLAIDEV